MKRHRPVPVPHDSEYLTLKQAAELIHFAEHSPHDPVNGFRKWAQRWGCPFVGHGKVTLIERRMFTEWMRREPWARRSA